MSKYEQVCDMLRERRRVREGVPSGLRYWNEVDTLAVIEDALIELGDLFRTDAKNARMLMGMTPLKAKKIRWPEIPTGLLLHRDEEQWPLQSEYDA